MVSIINKALDEGRHMRLALRARAIKAVDVMGVESAAARIEACGVRI
ncbi:hypothetical protein AB0D29_11020 [Streptomyces sp. NPDC048424]